MLPASYKTLLAHVSTHLKFFRRALMSDITCIFFHMNYFNLKNCHVFLRNVKILNSEGIFPLINCSMRIKLLVANYRLL